MKVGTIRSPWRYDVGAYITTRQLKMPYASVVPLNAAPFLKITATRRGSDAEDIFGAGFEGRAL